MFIPLYVSCVRCQVSHVTYHVSCVTCQKKFNFFYKKKKKNNFFVILKTNWTTSTWWSQSVEGLLSTGPTPSSFHPHKRKPITTCTQPGLLLNCLTQGSAVPPVCQSRYNRQNMSTSSVLELDEKQNMLWNPLTHTYM